MVDTKWFQGEKQEAEPVVSSELEIVIDCAPNFLVLSKIKLLVLGLGKSLTIRNRVRCSLKCHDSCSVLPFKICIGDMHKRWSFTAEMRVSDCVSFVRT